MHPENAPNVALHLGTCEAGAFSQGAGVHLEAGGVGQTWLGRVGQAKNVIAATLLMSCSVCTRAGLVFWMSVSKMLNYFRR